MSHSFYITEDFSKEMLEIRKDLQEKLKLEKEKGNEAFIRNNKLIIKEKTEVEKRKRESSASPKDLNVATSGEKNIIAPSKMHKTDIFTYMRARSSSLSEKNTQQQKA